MAKKTGLNSNVKASTKSKVIAALEQREATGKIGKNDAARLAALRGTTTPGTTTPGTTTPETDAGLTVDNNINTDTGRISNPQDLLDQAGKLYDPNDPYWKDVYNNTYKTTYDLQTSGLQERQARDVEEARQIAAERGLPYNPSTQGVSGDPNTAYGKQVGGVYDRYDQMYKDATNASTLAAQSAWETQGNLANDSFTRHVAATLGISEAEARAKVNELTKYGIDKDYKAKMAAVAASGKKSGGGSSSGGSSGGGGFDVVL